MKHLIIIAAVAAGLYYLLSKTGAASATTGAPANNAGNLNNPATAQKPVGSIDLGGTAMVTKTPSLVSVS